MSNIYNTEPPTKGKVTLKTTIGDLDIELWPKEAPKAVRNFVQLCMEGYYDGTVFHRVIKDFMAQAGDPTGTGEGGESVYGGSFRDEFHSRLRFSHRGLLACANRNEPNTNGSQFFITLDKCEWLDRKNTIFGKIVGDTIYNMLRLNELEVDEATDRPADPPVITGAEVLWNPFDDIVPRTTPAERRAEEQFKRAEEGRKEKRGRKRNLALLSFGEEAQEEEADLRAAGGAPKIRSAHEVLKGDAKLLAPEETPEEVLAEQAARAAAIAAVQDKLRGSGGGGGDSMRARGGEGGGEGGAASVVAQRVQAAANKAAGARSAREAAAAAAAAAAADGGERGRDGERRRSCSRSRGRSRGRGGRSSSSDGSDSSDSSRSRSRGRDGGRGKAGGREAAAAAAAASAKDAGAAAGGAAGSKPRSKEDEMYELKAKQGAGRVRVRDDVVDGELLKAFELSRQKYKTRKQQVGSRQKDTLARLAAFQDKLRGGGPQQQRQQQEQQQQQQQQQAGGQAGADEAYDGKVRSDIDHRAYMPAAWRVDEYLAGGEGEEDDDDLASLRQHRLEFSKAPGDAMARRDDLDDYVVHDPLLEQAKGKFSRAAQREKKKQTSWAGRGQG